MCIQIVNFPQPIGHSVYSAMNYGESLKGHLPQLPCLGTMTPCQIKWVIA